MRRRKEKMDNPVLTTLFFDLDHTLWDFERNSGQALAETLQDLGLIGRNGLTTENFIPRYHLINERMWGQYRRGEIEKNDLRTRRFEQAFALFSIREKGLAECFADRYLELCPRKGHLFDGAEETLRTLSAKYPIWLLSNGFSEVQAVKIENPGIKPYISGMVTSEEAGAKKPAKEIFDYALAKAGAVAGQSAMVGDDLENDVCASLACGFGRAVWFNPLNKERKGAQRIVTVHSLRELTAIF